MADSFQPDTHGADSFTPDAPEQSLMAGLKEYGHQMNPVNIAKGIWQTVSHPIDSAKAYLDAKQKMVTDAEDSLSKGDWGGFLRHMQTAAIPIPGIDVAVEQASNKWDSGDKAGALGDAAALVSQMAIGAKAGDIGQAGANAVKFGGAAIPAAAPDVGAGLGKVLAGEAVAKLPGMEWPARLAMGWPGARQIAKGIEKGGVAGRAALKPSVSTAMEAAPAAAPAVEALADGTTVNDILKGQGIKNPAKATPEARAGAQSIFDRIKAAETPQTAPAVNPQPTPQPAVPTSMPSAAAPTPVPTPVPTPAVPRTPLRPPLAPQPAQPVPTAPPGPAQPVQAPAPSSAPPGEVQFTSTPLTYRGRPAIQVEAVKDGETVGMASFIDQGNGVLKPNDLTVVPEYRRQGIATRLYDTAKQEWSKSTGKQTTIIPDTVQTPAGAAFRKAYDQPETPAPSPAAPSAFVTAAAAAKSARYADAISKYAGDHGMSATQIADQWESSPEARGVLTLKMKRLGYLGQNETIPNTSAPGIVQALRAKAAKAATPQPTAATAEPDIDW